MVLGLNALLAGAANSLLLESTAHITGIESLGDGAPSTVFN